MKKLKKFRAAVSSLVSHQLDRGTDLGTIAHRLREEADELYPLPPTPATNVEMFEALKKAGDQFLFYERQHLAKGTSEAMEKANVNRRFAVMCFQAIGEPIATNTGGSGGREAGLTVDLPKMMGEDAFADWKAQVEAKNEAMDANNAAEDAPESPVERDSSLPPAKALLRAIHDAAEPLKGLNLPLDERPVLSTLVELGYATQDDVSDKLGITTKGREFLGIKPEGTIDLPVTVAEVTGNIDEAELAARYMEGKVAAIDAAIRDRNAPMHEMSCSWEESYQHAALSFRAAADEFRQGLHLPSVHIDGRVIPYNEDRSTGISHRVELGRFFDDVYQRNVQAGWWTDLETGKPKKRSVGELFMLFVTEIAEAYDAYVVDAADDKLPDYPGLGVELADLGIRWADFCGALAAGNIVAYSDANNPGDRHFRDICMIAGNYEKIRKTPEAVGQPETGDYLPGQDVSKMVDAKLAYNATRSDHKIENRLKADGKKT